jgi:hypothetical protein
LKVKVRLKKLPDIITKSWRKKELYRNLRNKRVKKPPDETNKKDVNFVTKQLGFGKQMIKHMLTEESIDLIKTVDDNCNKKDKCNIKCSALNREGKVEGI